MSQNINVRSLLLIKGGRYNLMKISTHFMDSITVVCLLLTLLTHPSKI